MPNTSNENNYTDKLFVNFVYRFAMYMQCTNVFQSVFMQMSHTTSSHGIEKRVTEDGRDEKETTFVSKDSSSPARSVRQRVLKEVGLTSTTFIGPAFPPNKVKSDIEDTLSEFYKELEKIDTPDGADGNSGKQNAVFFQSPIPPKTSTSKEFTYGTKEKIIKSSKTDCYRSSEQKPPSWPHWYQNEPYFPRRPRPVMHPESGRAATNQNQWHYPQTVNRPRLPNPRFHRPPFHHPTPSSAFPNPQNLPSRMNHNWGGPGMTNQYQEEAHFPTFCSIPPPNVPSHLSQGLYGDSPHHFDGDKQGRSYDAHSDNVNVGWSRDRKEEWCQLNEDYDQRYDAENDLWEHHCQPPDNNNAYHSSLVLILMRGLPGSGKSTLARYVSVILSLNN